MLTVLLLKERSKKSAVLQMALGVQGPVLSLFLEALCLHAAVWSKIELLWKYSGIPPLRGEELNRLLKGADGFALSYTHTHRGRRDAQAVKAIVCFHTQVSESLLLTQLMQK